MRHTAKRAGRLALVAWLVAAAPAAPAIRADSCHDALITADVKARLFADRGLGVFKINVDTDECVVSLVGCVDTAEQKKRATAIARRVKKVRAVHNRLSLCPHDEGDGQE
ncbi:MAG TPA: BON domain-containing protein [Candidatus Polarisedimenticolia bacterium]|nr:BON domain-containing protein [Candidatus Polarisedimenticolia bacterium]